MKHKQKEMVAPLAAASIFHGLCSAEKRRHEHVPNDVAVDFYALAGKTVAVGFTTAVAGLPLTDLAKSTLDIKRIRRRQSKRSRRP